MAEKKAEPAIRFKGFTDPWEQRKLGDISDSYSGGTPQANNPAYYKGGIPFIRSAEINADKTELYLTEKGLNESSATMIDVGCILYALYGATSGEVGIARIKGAINQAILAIEPHKGFNSRYIAFWLRAQKAIITETYLQGGQGNLSGAIIKNLDLPVPSFSEQQRIGDYFDKLTSLITLHQRKYDKLCELKKSMLDKMFPKPGESVPEIRFKGFTDPWEQRKFSDMYEVNNERNTDCGLGYDRTLSIATMSFNGGNGAADDSLRNYKVIRVGDIAFEGHANKVHAYGRFVLNDAGDGLMSPRFSCLRPIVEQRYSFWKYYIPHEEVMKPILVKATKSGTMMNELVPDDLMRESILVPCLAEQEAIGDGLSQLDNLITLHQRKLEALKNLKKAMLDKMFV